MRTTKSTYCLFNLSKPFVVCLALMLNWGASNAQQTKMYDVIRNDNKVGTLKTSSVNTSMGQMYYIESFVKVWVVINIKVNYNQSNIYKDGVLRQGAVIRTVNGSTKMNNNILWQPGGGYICLKKDGDTVRHKEEIKYSTAMLYFAEPINLSRVYSEGALAFIPIKKTEDHTYELTLIDGNKNYYTYKNGVCVKVKAETDHGTVYFVAQ